MLERYEQIQRRRGHLAAAESARVVREQFGDVPFDAPTEGEIFPPSRLEVQSTLVETIVTEVCDYFSVTKEELVSKKRTRNVAIARKFGMHLAREMTTFTVSEIGGFFGRDHSVVSNQTKKLRNARAINPEVQEDLTQLKNRIANKLQQNSQ